jgi:predicted transcriptional regulator
MEIQKQRDELAGYQVRALDALFKHGPMQSDELAAQLWADTECWDKAYLSRALQNAVGNLAEIGLICRDRNEHGAPIYSVTEKGRALRY